MAESLYRIIEEMARTDLYLKVELTHSDDDKPERLAAEICRAIKKLHGVRDASLQSFLTSKGEDE